jgi:hypothetical protein
MPDPRSPTEGMSVPELQRLRDEARAAIEASEAQLARIEALLAAKIGDGAAEPGDAFRYFRPKPPPEVPLA